MDELPVGRDLPELAPDRGDVDVDPPVAVAGHGRAADGVKQLLLADDDAGVGDEQLQQLQLARGQVGAALIAAERVLLDADAGGAVGGGGRHRVRVTGRRR